VTHREMILRQRLDALRLALNGSGDAAGREGPAAPPPDDDEAA
jgi:hypothetical protein